ncbi:MAG TPA: HD-GYP domain-containing protein [Spirochaetota bacterium]|nr:HD-GYP domain-containing protein [Spirochaetota bacterium]HPC39817.1 HD-GYP domain-containing protein [Spirochaetota bacterium]HPL16317.1 HD-GYP domain-containing protein [Spirochaetota bacterium]HQF09864.1 HD-GYP domain-containing protein [Spirochaetota bacterium]HQH98514.1 HD-GYP domain-containing protein [Spirochaetota bacterium]
MAKMRKISVEELRPGMVYDKPIYVDSNNMLITANSPIKESDIKKLMTWGITEVETSGILIKRMEMGEEKPSEAAETGSSAEAASPPKEIDIDSEKKIVNDYNELLKKRKGLIEVHNRARNAVDAAYRAIRNNAPFETRDLEDAVQSIVKLLKDNSNIFLFLYGLDEGKDYTLTHSVNVTFYSLIIGIALKYNPVKLNDLGLGTLLIDAGMIKLPVYIIHKQSNLTDQEFNQIKTHPLLGYKALKELGKIKESSAIISLQHHEQFDGKGYPRGLRGNDIDEFARIAAIADSYEAQISNRSYRKKVYFYHAMRNLLSSGVNKFDPVILRVFLSRMSVYPIGSIVELNDGAIGIIIGSVPEKPLRPIIKVIFDKDRKRIENTTIISLLSESSLYIVRALDEAEVGINIFDVL